MVAPILISDLSIPLFCFTSVHSTHHLTFHVASCLFTVRLPHPRKSVSDTATPSTVLGTRHSTSKCLGNGRNGWNPKTYTAFPKIKRPHDAWPMISGYCVKWGQELKSLIKAITVQNLPKPSCKFLKASHPHLTG